MTTAADSPTAMEKAGVFVVGPAARGLEPPRSPEKRARYDQWANQRQAVISLGEKAGLLKRDAPDELQAQAQAAADRFRETAKKDPAIRAELQKREAYEATSATVTDADQEGLASYGFVGGVVQTPYPLEVLARTIEDSSILRQNIDAYEVNVDAFGHTFRPVLNFSDEAVRERVQEILLGQRVRESGKRISKLTPEDLAQIGEPTEKEVEDTLAFWKKVASLELAEIKTFFETLSPWETFTQTRRKTRQSRELLGNAAWELIREDPYDVLSPIKQINQLSFVNTRLTTLDEKPTKTKVRVRKSEVEFEEVEAWRHFRRYVRVLPTLTCWYKEQGDPRVVSRRTGRFFADQKALQAGEGQDALPANELYHWTIPCQTSPYGVPRWVGALLAILGSRAAEEVNWLYFDNKAIPPMVLIASGGTVTDGTIERLRSYFSDEAKGREKFHDVLIIEGLPADSKESSGDTESSGKLRLELKPLMGDMLKDGMFLDLDASNRLKVGQSFRQPPLLTGDQRDANRSTAEVVKALAEEQVYQPERDEFDGVINRLIFADREWRFWTFMTNAPVNRLANDLIANLNRSLDAGAITPNEARPLLGNAFGVTLNHVDEDWAKMPTKLAQAEARVSAAAPTHAPGGTAGPEGAFDQEGEVVARGKTSETDGHAHSYVALRGEGGKVHLITMAHADGHTHPAVEVALPKVMGVESPMQLAVPALPGGHGHLAHLTPRVNPAKVRQRNVAAALALALRPIVRDELELAEGELFNPAEMYRSAD